MKSRTTVMMLTMLAVIHFSGWDAQAIRTERVASGLTLPLFVTAAPGDASRIFVVEQRQGTVGRIRIARNGALLARPFLSISPVSTGSEQGLLGMAFRPDYADSGVFFISYTRADGASVLARYRVSENDPDSADAASSRIALIYPQPFSNHNGGMIAFGPDGYLYYGLGDGGSGNDPGNRAQSDTTLLGKLLRLDVTSVDSGYAIPPDNPFAGPDGIRDEIWAKGLRNPWRFGFDRATGDLYIADVGQGAREEIDFQPASSVGGENYGWRCMEANLCTGLSGCTCNSPQLTDPIYEYIHQGGGCWSITGGYLYRGCAIPELQGTYFFAEYCRNFIWSFRYDGDTLTEFQDRTAELAPGGSLSITSVSSFGEDALGELYICDLNGGEVFKILPDSLTDCNHNGRADDCDIAIGVSMDGNQNGIPDECECAPTLVSDVICSADSANIVLRWTAVGTGTETYRVYRTAQYEPFPGGSWLMIADSLPSPITPNPVTYADSNIVNTANELFYVVTTLCP